MERPIFRLLPIIHLAKPPGCPHLGFFGPHLVADFFLLGENFLIFLVVSRANGRRAFEHHVFEQVRDPGDAGAFIRAADVRDPAPGDGRIIVSFDHEQRNAVGESFFNDVNFLSGGRCHERELQNRNGKEGQGVFI